MLAIQQGALDSHAGGADEASLVRAAKSAP